ncbi:DUF3987 domain-containing protein [Trichormus variabilis]|uniref:Primase C-terminal 1 domain-containing protein n=1 Tax=Trichormus variabilis NIES-23 TaxID=1973479 RepID=A0A1Z4KX58_ANAVA|nr:DUF3987 domain-containing protein [Trichormus variabilis]BAY73555.1 hypothetical protein NIES23_64070 [Trichormus variabilis NIES-23]
MFIQYPEDADNPAKNNLIIDRAQAIAHLQALGYKEGNTVYLRSFYPSNDSRKIGDKGRKAEAKNINQLLQLATQFQAEGRGVYFVVNGGGHTNESVSDCRAIFYEHDNLDKELQKHLWRSLGLPEPSLQIDTGGKSIHSYWIFDSFINPQQWKQLQTDLLEYTDADRALKNPSRVMRLAGCWHFAPNNVPSGQTKIILNSGKRYSYDELRAIIPTPAQKQKALLPTSIRDLQQGCPLYLCLSKENRRLIDSGAGSGERNTKAYSLACDLIGTAATLDAQGYRYSQNPRDIFDDYCCKCSPPLGSDDATEPDKVWKSATGDNPKPALSEDYIIECIKAWVRKETIPSHERATMLHRPEVIAHDSPDNKISNVVLHPTAFIPYDELKTEYINLLNSGASKSQKSRFKTEVNKKYYPVKLERFLDDVETEYRASEDDELIKEDIQKVLDCANLELDIRQFLPQKLATALMLFGINQSLPQTSLMMSLISVISASHQIGAQVLIGNKHNEFYQNPAINHALVGDSGSGKSIIFRSLVKKPLNALRKEENKRFASESQQYEKNLAAWEQSDKSTPQPEPPKPINRMYLTGATLEGLKDYIAKAPDNSILNVVDELSGLFGGFNQYKRGQGNDRQEFLSLYDGDGFSEAKVSKNIFVERTNTSWLGGLQPTILHKHFELGASDGLLPRFTFSVLPEIIRLLPDENTQSIDITGILTGLYRATLSCQPQTYHITGEAYKYFREVDTKWQYEAARLPNGALKEFLKKCKGLLGRLSLNLHLIHELSDPFCGTPPTIIPVIRVKQAADIVEHLLSQIQAVHLQIAGETTQSAIVAMINLSHKRQSLGEEGWLTAREIGRHQSAKGRMKCLEIRELMTKAKEMGYGEIRGSGTKLEWSATKNVGDLSAIAKNTPKPDISVVLNLDTQKMSADVGDLSAMSKTPEAVVNTGLELNEVNFVGDVGDFSDVFEGNELIINDKNVGDLNLLVNPNVVNPVVNPDEKLSLNSPTTPTNLENVAETIANTNVESADILPTNLPTTADNRRQNSDILPSTTEENSISDLPPTDADRCRQNSPILPTDADNNCQQNEEQELSTEEPQATTDEPQQIITEKDAVKNVWANAELIRECIDDESWGLIATLTEEWTSEFKSAVWKELTPQERQAVNQLKVLE